MSPPSSSPKYLATQQRLIRRTQRRARAIAGRLLTEHAEWETDVRPQLEQVIGAAQAEIAGNAEVYVHTATTELGIDATPLARVNPAGWSLATNDGQPLGLHLDSVMAQIGRSVESNVKFALAVGFSQKLLGRIVDEQLKYVDRAAAQTAIALRPKVTGWVRMINPPSCKECIILAGKFYRWNQGFLRHDRCKCRHIPSTEVIAGDLTTDPYEYFKSLGPKDQDKLFGKNDARAIREGADISRVVNIRRRGLATSVGRKGWQGRRYGTPSKMTIDDIMAKAGDSRAKAVQLLTREGYIVPGGQVAGGTIKGNVPNPFSAGYLGRGGTRVGATHAFRTATSTGIRDPLEPATMTAAERRLLDAVLSKQAVDRGVNPFGRWALTRQDRALVERVYARQLELVADEDAPASLRELAALLRIRGDAAYRAAQARRGRALVERDAVDVVQRAARRRRAR